MTIESWARSGKTEQRIAFRSKIILAAREGQENQAIARAIAITALSQKVDKKGRHAKDNS
jgi:hypothetical protein